MTLVVLLPVCAHSTRAQSSDQNEPKSNALIMNRRAGGTEALDAPTVYLNVERKDKEKVWLRMHNNTRWAIAVRTFTFNFNRERSIDLGNGKSVFALPGDEEIDSLHYYVEKEPTASRQTKAPKLFHGDSSAVSWIPANGSILFSVPKEQIEPGLMVYVPFHYSSELNEQLIFNNEPEHRVYFRGVDLISAMEPPVSPGLPRRTLHSYGPRKNSFVRRTSLRVLRLGRNLLTALTPGEGN